MDENGAKKVKPIAVILGVGSGLSTALARKLAPEYDLVLGARSQQVLDQLEQELSARCVTIDSTDQDQVSQLFAELPAPPRVAVYNPSARLRGPITELDPGKVRQALEVTAFGAFLMGRAAAGAMLSADPIEGKRGTILFTGASAGVKGFPQSAPFAMGKFAQRGLAQSMARELHPKGIHVAWINIDGGIRNPTRPERIDAPDNPDSMLNPEAIAQEYLNLINQHRSAWSKESTLRPWAENF